MQRDTDISIDLGVRKGKLHLHLGAIGFAKKVISHGHGVTLARELNPSVLEAHRGPGLQRKALVFWELSVATNKVGHGALHGRAELDVRRFGGTEEQTSVRNIERLDKGFRPIFSLGEVRGGLSHVHDCVAPGALRVLDIGFVHQGSFCFLGRGRR